MSDQKCPECGDAMSLRTNKITGRKFFGCKKWPSCDGTLRYEEEEVIDDELPSARVRGNDRQRWRNE